MANLKMVYQLADRYTIHYGGDGCLIVRLAGLDSL